MTVMNSTAKITITSGPDRGQVFEIRDEIVRIGGGPANEIPLSDPDLAEQQVRIISRNGRYAMSASIAGLVEVDGNALPAERWVWLPATARVQFGGKTAFQFESQPAEPGEESGAAEGSEAATPAPRRRENPGDSTAGGARRRKAARKPEKSGGRQVARFITDQKGDALVRLGEDGRLPVLTLQEAAAIRKKDRGRLSGERNQVLVYAVMAASMLLSAVLLLVEFDRSNVSEHDREEARRAITAFYGAAGETIEPYQMLLREARLAHSRKDSDGERRAYREVLDLLDSDDNNPITGLSGDRDRDEELRALVTTLLSR